MHVIFIISHGFTDVTLQTMQPEVLLYLINIHHLTVNFDWPSAGHVQCYPLTSLNEMLHTDVIQCKFTL